MGDGGAELEEGSASCATISFPGMDPGRHPTLRRHRRANFSTMSGVRQTKPARSLTRLANAQRLPLMTCRTRCAVAQWDPRYADIMSVPSDGRTAELSQFAAHVELRAQPKSASLDKPAGAFLGHFESQRQITAAAVAILRRASKRKQQLLGDVIQQANLLLLADLRQRKAIFEGDDPERFVGWFRGASRNVSIDAIRDCLRACANSKEATTLDGPPDPTACDPVDVAIFRELARLTGDKIEGIHDTNLREVMRDFRDGKKTRESAVRLRISKSKVNRLRTRGCRLIAKRLAT